MTTKIKNEYQDKIFSKFAGSLRCYHPGLDEKLGSKNAGKFVVQLMYWHKRNVDPDGIYKTYKEWKEEIGLSKRELIPVIKLCVGLGFLSVKTKIPKGRNLGPVNHYLLDLDKLYKLTN